MLSNDERLDSNLKHRSTIELIFKNLLYFALVIVICYKILVTNFELLSFNFSELLSLILGMFSIGLAVMFYIKANETSNRFYDNTYKFTENVSIILGRIEAGFGERLKHLDEGYNRINEAIYQTPRNEIEAKKEIKSNEEVLENVLKEREKIIQNLLMRAKLADSERIEIDQKLKQKDTELQKVQSELQRLKSEFDLKNNEIVKIENEIADYFKRYIVHEFPKFRTVSSDEEFKNLFFLYINDYSQSWLEDCKKYGFVSGNGHLTTKGLANFRAVARNLR